MSKRGLTLAGMCLAIFIILCYRISSNIGNTKQTQVDLGIIQDSNIEEQSKGQICISRAQVAKMLALLVYSHDEIQGIIYDNPYTDVEEGAWYAPYINATLLMGITWGEDTARPVDNITYNECREVLIGMLPEAVSKVEEFMAQVQNQKEGTTAVDGSEWLEIFEKLRRGELVADGVEKPCYREMLNEDVFLLSLIEGEGISWEVATSAGAYHFDGFALDAFKNSTINILSDGNEILYIYGASNAQTVLRNAWIMGSTQNELSVFY